MKLMSPYELKMRLDLAEDKNAFIDSIASFGGWSGRSKLRGLVADDGCFYFFDKHCREASLSGVSHLCRTPHAMDTTCIPDGCKLVLPPDLEQLASGLLAGEMMSEAVIGDKLVRISDDAFFRCEKLKHVNLPDTLKDINDNAFMHCTSLESIEIPDSVKSLGRGAFDGCTSLKHIKLSSSCTSLPDFLFYRCTSLEEIVVPACVNCICRGTFLNCSSLTHAVFEGKTEDQMKRLNGWPFGIRSKDCVFEFRG